MEKKINFITKLLFLVVVSAGPFNANAGFLDAVSGWFGSDTSVAIAEDDSSGSKATLLEAAVNTNPTSSSTVDSLSLVDGKALLSEVGVNGTIVDVDDGFSDQISVYVVRKGDTLTSISKMFDVTPNTIKWANDLKGTPKEGDILTILPISGIKYVVKKGDTLASIAKKYKADVVEIGDFNDLTSDKDLIAGSEIIIPDAEPEVVKGTTKKVASKTSKKTDSSGPSYSGYYIKPISGARKSQGIHGHNGIDFAGVPVGTPVLASAPGTVIVAKNGGWNGAYGSYVVISHPNGTQTLYAHLNSVAVNRGDRVSQGQVIGGMGNTGRSTGPHLHFEIRGAKNPF